MSRSWGHAVGVLSDSIRAQYRRQGELERARWGSELRGSSDVCRTGKCEEFVSHVVRYKYITGRAGRVSDCERLVCGMHAEKFAHRYDIDFSAAPIVSREVGGGFARLLREWRERRKV
jgi:hypothetical protein